MDSKNKKLNIKKKTIITLSIIVIAVIALALVFHFFLVKSEVSKNKTIAETYKSELYNSMICEFKCPNTLQEFKGKNQSLPDADCVRACSADFVAKNYSLSELPRNELLQDGFLSEISSIVGVCQNSSISNFNLNLTAFSSCALEKLEPLRDEYSYLSN